MHHTHETMICSTVRGRIVVMIRMLKSHEESEDIFLAGSALVYIAKLILNISEIVDMGRIQVVADLTNLSLQSEQMCRIT